MKALLTGASGFVGRAVLQALIEEGIPVKVMLRGEVPEHLRGFAAEVCRGDLCDPDSLKRAIKGCDHLFHVAAHYKLWEADPGVFYRINVEGTRRLLSLAAENSFAKIVYTSSVATIRPPEDETPANEDRPTRVEDLVGHYKRSKFLAEQEAQKLADAGAPIVIVNPSAPVGPYDVKPTPTGKIIVDYLQGKMFGYLRTGLNLVAVEDVAKGHLLAADRGRPGRRYILGNRNLHLIEIFRMLEKISGVRAPNFQVPYALAYCAAMASEAAARISGNSPEIPLDGVRMARKFMFFDSARAYDELDYRPTPIEEALERAVAWFRRG